MTLSTADGDASFTDQNIHSSGGILDFEMPSPQNDLWIHFCAEMGLHQSSGRTIGGFNIEANRFDFYWWRSTADWQALYMWNGSTYVEVGNRALFSEPQGVRYYDLHYTVHPTDGVLELYMDDTVLLRATGLNTSGFVINSIQFAAMQNSPVRWSQFIISDEPTVCWRVMNRSVLSNTETIQVVGYNFQSIAGAVSGNTDVSLTSLIGGIGSAPEPDDYVVAVFGTASTVDRTLSITDGTTAYTLVGNELYANDNFDLNLRVAIKKMGPTPDSFVRFGPTQAVNDAGVIGVLVLRGVDPTTFVDGTISNIQTANGSQPNPGSIIVATLLSKVMVVGGAAHDGTVTNFNNVPNLPFFIQFGSSGVNSVRIFVGLSSERETTSSVDYAPFTTNVNISTSSTGIITFAVRPERVAQTFSDTPNDTSLLTATPVRTAANQRLSRPTNSSTQK